MLIVNILRENLIHLLPKNGVGVEIGVAEGDFAETLLTTTKPKRLHLIDPWTFQQREDYRDDPNNVPTSEGDRRHQAVLARFQDRILSGEIEVHRQFSCQARTKYPENYFDWIYVDALHTYDGVRSDLEDYFPLVRDGGFILGHDYTNRKGAREWNFAVVEAVNDFIRSNDCKLIAVTQEVCPTYMIMKRHYTDFTAYQTIIRALTQNASICFEVPDHLLGHLRHNEISSPHGLRCWFGF